MRRFTAFITVLLMLMLSCTGAIAVQATSYTYTLDDTHHYMRTQDAYLPIKTITELGLSKPEDLFFSPDGLLYIADTGNRRVLIFDTEAAVVVGEIKHAGFKAPRGLFITESGDLYVADPGAKTVFQFSPEHELIHEFTRPDSPMFADTNYEPAKIAVDGGGSLYIVSEGVYSGVLQLAPTGEFLGYFAVNKAAVTFTQMMQRMLYTREQLSNLTDIVPTTFSNVYVDSNGIVYTTTMGTDTNGIKKHSTLGGNMFIDPVYGYEDMSDVYVDKQGLIYVANMSGYIDVYSTSGELVFEFGSFVTNLDISGLFASLPALAVAPNGDIWAVDGLKGYLQSFTPTEYALMVYSAMGLYEQGFYEESLEKWSAALKLNQMSILAHNGVGKALFHAGRYAESMPHFEVAGNRKFYSEAFWEVRNEALQKVLPYVVGGAALLALVAIITKRARKKRGRSALRRAKDAVMNAKGLRGVLCALTMARHPMNGYYELRMKRMGSVPGATALYGLAFILYMLYQTSKGFVFQTVRLEDIDVGALAAGFLLAPAMFIVFNWLVSSIKDGDGTLKKIYMVPAYALAPVLAAMAINLGLSYAVTSNEAFMLSIIEWTGIIWSVVTMFCGLMVVHDYSFKETIISLLITVVFMLLAVVVFVMIFIMVERLYQFLGTLVEEVYRNALE